MSTTIDDKISLFTKVIFERLEHEYSEKYQKLVDRYEAQKAALSEEFKKKMEEKVSEAAREANVKREQMVSRARADAHFEVLRKREELLERLLNEVRDKIKKFLNTPGYMEFLKKMLVQVTSRFPKGEKIIYIFTPTDLGKYEQVIRSIISDLKPPGEFEIVSGDDSMIGGVVARSESGRIEVDLSVDTLVEENRSVLARLLYNHLSGEV
ncbi:V-type ATP synthase subunit E [Thermosediminibacter oceani]|uniref:H+transporting two-sector ATPase E subunit n=1 Tax=Thermosediminibacter oceani (strain ATCC BAA-1034 / DSM 16646 / JW/IW-1228P) TaxID=555079 RepID=D9RYN4_THEOJ|nr:V-type ATP synthase subunit E [Thermosediminibacter oceani]ADL08458.1 H+transporting two-sector ATPase E subunit [Thermosediminibacter oceani DSM 16646]